jgi:hypothetical protein
VKTRSFVISIAAGLLVAGVAAVAVPAGAQSGTGLSGCITEGTFSASTCPAGSPTITSANVVGGYGATDINVGATPAGAVYQGGGPVAGLSGMHLNAPIVGVVSADTYGAYWLVASDGGVFAFNTPYYGSMGGKPLNAPIVGMALSGGGYWLVASDGGVFSFGDAGFYGSMGGKLLNSPIVGMAPSGGGGYYLVASDGGVFAFGDAQFDGSRGGQPLNSPVVGMATTSGGYWLASSDGGIFAYGDAPFLGSYLGLGAHVIAVGIIDPYGIDPIDLPGSPPPLPEGYCVALSNGQTTCND